jgi:hypothetical protein
VALLVSVPFAWAKRRFGNPVFHNPLARRLAVRTDQNASGLRVAYLLGALLAGGAAAMLPLFALGRAASWLAREAPGLPVFLQRHFN